ncbi:hypothetical protein G7047_05025 [Diaphorobacter sp. HDW4A]|uniref:hypothetical protein n=1 Tax=Diaphorobacter sp. HDW4A TaxID=2714924 RepID=UPI00140BC054|nr:hypothetical protein [Diaphorobacter sp. HDW4A]QIL79339.1 hypothetical protein G7047_05025 [Diaphorobacter sp. HDW4A]
MSSTLRFLSTLLLAIFATTSLAMTKAEHSAEKHRIANEYKSAILHCRTLVGNARDVCKQQAKGRVGVAKAQLNARANPSVKSAYKVDVAKAKAANSVARERCDDLVGEARSVCNRRAKANYASAKDRAASKR